MVQRKKTEKEEHYSTSKKKHAVLVDKLKSMVEKFHEKQQQKRKRQTPL